MTVDVLVLGLVCVAAVVVAAVRSIDLQHARQELQAERERNNRMGKALDNARHHRERLYAVLVQVNFWPAGPTRLVGWEGIPGHRRDMDKAISEAERLEEER